MRNNRIVMPKPLQAETLIAIHKGHQDITKCREGAKHSVWWPGLSKEVQAMVKNRSTCCKTQTQYAEPMISTQFPTLPWQRVGTDLFEYKGMHYLLVIDYFSRYIEIANLSSTSSNAVITHLKSFFARPAFPQYVISDNGPQFSADVFSTFSNDYGFTHTV